MWSATTGRLAPDGFLKAKKYLALYVDNYVLISPTLEDVEVDALGKQKSGSELNNY